MALTGYLAPEGFEAQLETELGAAVAARHGRLFLCPEAPRDVAWAANTWFDVEELPIASIGDGAKQLRARGRNWALLPIEHHRRAALIAERLPSVSFKPLVFPAPAPSAPLGSWALVAPDRLLLAARCSSPFAHGEARFVEDRAGPPNRAYLKLWEALTVAGARPAPGELCLDLGASPGGWTWVLASLEARVIAIDKAPLDPKVAALPGVDARLGSAFALEPASLPPVDWLVCDVVSYPKRLLGLIRKWLDAGRARRIVATLKFQGDTDFETIAAFRALPGGQLRHLHHNRHELTFFRL
jgi:23S rRNA (cytidine2498-2'-O)-methyltransferase